MHLDNMGMLMFSCLLSVLLTQCTGGYEYVFKDYMVVDGIMREVRNADRLIHCAAACMRDPECKGFATDASKKCFLLDIFMERDYCNHENCTDSKGSKVYMDMSKREKTTTTTTVTPLPTTTTTTTMATTTTEEPTSTTTTKPTTTTTTTPTTTTTTTPTTTTTTTTPTTTTTTTTTTTEPTTTTTTTVPTTTTTTEPTTTTTTMEPTTTTSKPTTSTTTEKTTTTAEPTTTTTEPTTTTTEPTTTTTEPTTTTTTTEPTTTSTTEPTTTTTEEPTTTTTTEMTTTTTTMQTTTTTEASVILEAGCDGDTEIFNGFLSGDVFFNGGIKEAQCTKLSSQPFTSKPMRLPPRSGKQNGQCMVDGIITKLEFNVISGHLKNYTMTCRIVKKSHLKTGKIRKANSKETGHLECGENAGLIDFRAELDKEKKDSSEYILHTACQQIEEPKKKIR